jgi:cell division protein FtsB
MSDTEITFTGAYTCTNHNDRQRAECPVCLVAKLTAERDQLRAEVERLKHGTVAQFKDAFIDELKRENAELRASSDEHAETVALANWNGALERAEKAEAELAKYLSACPASPTEEERKRCQQWWAISGKSP